MNISSHVVINLKHVVFYLQFEWWLGDSKFVCFFFFFFLPSELVWLNILFFSTHCFIKPGYSEVQISELQVD